MYRRLNELLDTSVFLESDDKLAVNRRFSIAPMMAYSDRHSRYFLRLFSQRSLQYTEMGTAAAVVHGDQDYLLGFSPEEHPLAVQLGGSNPEQLYQAAKI
jgi:tRNA-dihydrouridine synthase A